MTDDSTSGISVTTNPINKFAQAGIAQSIPHLCKGSKYTLSWANQISVATDAKSFCRVFFGLKDQVLATFVSLFRAISLFLLLIFFAFITRSTHASVSNKKPFLTGNYRFAVQSERWEGHANLGLDRAVRTGLPYHCSINAHKSHSYLEDQGRLVIV